MKYYFKTYDISGLDFNEIEIRTNKRIEEANKFSFGERLNLTNYGGNEQKILGYAGEELILELDKDCIRPEDVSTKYDYIKNGIYIDLKTLKTSASINKIIDYGYTVMLLANQVYGAKNFCDDNGIDYKKYRFEVLYWDGLNGKCIRSTNDNLILENILKTNPIKGKPQNTFGTSEDPYQFVIKMSGYKEENILL